MRMIMTVKMNLFAFICFADFYKYIIIGFSCFPFRLFQFLVRYAFFNLIGMNLIVYFPNFFLV